MKLLRRLLAYCFTPAPSPRHHHQDSLTYRQQRLQDDARERVRRTPL
jgi:hypothetical protein